MTRLTHDDLRTAGRTAGARPKYKRSLKNYLLDPTFQLKWTGMIIGVAFVISAHHGRLPATARASEVTEQSQKVIAQGEALIDESQKNSDLVKMQIKEQYGDAPELAETFNKSAKELDDAARGEAQAAARAAAGDASAAEHDAARRSSPASSCSSSSSASSASSSRTRSWARSTR